MYALNILQEAEQAGQKAYENKLNELRLQGPQWAIQTESGNLAGVLNELCGFAWVNIHCKRGTKNAKFIKELKSAGVASSDINDHNPLIKLSKDSYYGGYIYWIHVPTQGIDSKVAFAREFVRILKNNEIECYCSSRLD